MNWCAGLSSEAVPEASFFLFKTLGNMILFESLRLGNFMNLKVLSVFLFRLKLKGRDAIRQ